MLLISNKAGKIKIRIFAILLLGLSVSGLLSAYRSISREFHGIVLKKHSTANRYWLELFPTSKDTTFPLDNEQIVLALTNKITGTRVGVSSVVYKQIRSADTVSKLRFSQYVTIDDERYIDLGVMWFIYSVIGIIISFLMYKQTTKPSKLNKEPEEIL